MEDLINSLAAGFVGGTLPIFIKHYLIAPVENYISLKKHIIEMIIKYSDTIDVEEVSDAMKAKRTQRIEEFRSISGKLYAQEGSFFWRYYLKILFFRKDSPAKAGKIAYGFSTCTNYELSWKYIKNLSTHLNIDPKSLRIPGDILETTT